MLVHRHLPHPAATFQRDEINHLWRWLFQCVVCRKLSTRSAYFIHSVKFWICVCDFMWNRWTIYEVAPCRRASVLKLRKQELWTCLNLSPEPDRWVACCVTFSAFRLWWFLYLGFVSFLKVFCWFIVKDISEQNGTVIHKIRQLQNHNPPPFLIRKTTSLILY
jgi:hypothetical protein